MKTRFGKIFVCLTAVSLLTVTVARADSKAVFRGAAAAEIVSVVPGSGGVEMTANGSGYATQLGKYTRVETIVLDPSTGAFTGTVVFTASNGDRLTADVTGAFNSQTTASGSYAITGGTGRFADASGTAEFTVELVDPTHFFAEFAGTIALRG